MKRLGFGTAEAFPFLDAPDPKLISDGYRTLEELAALDDSGRLTPIGEQLARLPVDPRIGRMLLAAKDYHCLTKLLTKLLIIPAALSVQDPRERPPDQQQVADQIHATFSHADSDFLTFSNLWRFLEKERGRLSKNQLAKLCRRHFLSWNRVREWRDTQAQLRLVMREMGCKEIQAAGSYEEIHRALLTGLLGNIGCKEGLREYQGTRRRLRSNRNGSSKPPPT